MKILLFDTTNAFLTPGGKTTHALKLQQEISKLGVDIQFSRWWDKSQEDADIIHFLVADTKVAQLAKMHGIKTFFSMIFDFESNKSEKQKKIQRLKNHLIDYLPSSISSVAYCHALKYMDKIQFMHQFDKINAFQYFPQILKEENTVIIPHAYDPMDMNISNHLNIAEMHYPTKYLISCANISERKQTVKLAYLAKKAQVPIVFIGNCSKTDPYFKRFEQEIDNKFVFYPGYVSKEWKDCIEAHAAGYVLLSRGESGCIAVYEAAAYQIPLLLSNLPWAWGYENPTDIYYCDQQDEAQAIQQLRKFYNLANKMDHTPYTIHTWEDIAKLYVKEYNLLVNNYQNK